MSQCSTGINQRLVPLEAEPYYWRDGEVNGFYSIVKSLGIDVVNRVSNPSAEINLDGWSSDGGSTLTRTSDEPYDGTFGIQIDAPAPGAAMDITFAALQVASPFLQIDVPVGETYYSLIAVRACAGDTVTTFMTLDGIAAGLSWAATPVEWVSDGNWRLVQMSLTNTGALPVPVRIVVQIDNFSDCDVAYVDTAQITSVDIGTFFNGDDTFAVWDGAAHASTSTLQATQRAGGQIINLAEYNFDVIGDDGFGMPPVNLLTTPYARSAGAQYQRMQVLPRVLTITGRIEDCDPRQIHARRHELIRDIGLWDLTECGQEMALIYQYTDECGEPVGEAMRIEAEYNAGLGGTRTDITAETIVMQFVANRNPYWQSPSRTGVVLAQGDNDVEYEGTAPAFPIFRVRADPGPAILNDIINNANGAQLSFLGAGLFIPAGQYVLVNTQPGQVSVTLIDEATGNEFDQGQFIDYTISQPARLRLSPNGAQINSITMNGALANAETSMYWYNSWLSVDAGLRGC